MQKPAIRLAVASIALCLTPALSLAQQSVRPVTKGHVMVPASSIASPGDEGVKAHTNLQIFVPPSGKNFGAAVQPAELPPFAGFFFETPASLGCLYQLVHRAIPGCNPNLTTENPNLGKGGGAIAIVDAFDNPTAAADLATYSTQFGLPAAKFTVVYAQGSQPGQDPTGGWEIEESLDVQMAHAMSPQAPIFLVEAQDNSYLHLFEAVIVASNLVAANGGGEVSMSWGGGEFTEETEFDSILTTPGVVYFASAGDDPGVIYPSASPNVVSAGGTTVSRDPNSGNFLFENTWQDAGGGLSQVEPRPSFQNGVQFIVGGARGTPDLSFDANPHTGVWVYDSNAVSGTGWYVVGGTSVSSPALASIVNAAGSFHGSSQAENRELYNQFGNSFRDITFGNCGLNIGTVAQFGYDPCTGLGTPQGLRGK